MQFFIDLWIGYIKPIVSQAISAAKHLCFSFTVIQAGCRMPSRGLGLLCSNSLWPSGVDTRNSLKFVLLLHLYGVYNSLVKGRNSSCRRVCMLLSHHKIDCLCWPNLCSLLRKVVTDLSSSAIIAVMCLPMIKMLGLVMDLDCIPISRNLVPF